MTAIIAFLNTLSLPAKLAGFAVATHIVVISYEVEARRQRPVETWPWRKKK